MADYVAQSESKTKIHGPERFITVLYASCVSTVMDWSTDRWKSMWNEWKDCLRLKESVGWTSSRLIVRLLNIKRPQLNRVMQVLTGHFNLQRHKKTTDRAESSLCPKRSLEDETPTYHVGQGHPTRSPRATCGPPKVLKWQAKCFSSGWLIDPCALTL